MKLEFGRTGKARLGAAAVVGGALLLAGAPFAGIYCMASITKSAKRGYEARLAAVVAKYKACPDNYKTGCHCSDEASELAAKAQAAEGKGDYAGAGRIYADIGNPRANAMSDLCRRGGRHAEADSIYLAYGMHEQAVEAMNSGSAAATALEAAASMDRR
jgi:hypothetical protein